MSNVQFYNFNDFGEENPPEPQRSLENKQWQNIEEFTDDKDFASYMATNFPREAAVVKRAGMNRREFIKLMGASVALGGLTLTGCSPSRRQHEEIIPYVQAPEEVVLGMPLFFASTMVMGGYGTGVVIETHEGRPHRVEGNPNHPSSLGGSDVKLLASILELYNPARSTQVVNSGEPSTSEAFAEAMAGVVENLGDGSGLRILTEMVSSPSLVNQINELLEQYPEAQWYQYEPIARENVIAGSQLAFGENVNTIYRFNEANVIVALDANFLTGMPGSIAYAHDYAAGRKVREDNTEMNRVYAIESTPSNTGAVAEHLLTVRASEVEAFTLALADALGVDGGQAADNDAWTEYLEALVADLQANEGASVVVAGDEQTPVVHAMAHAINAALGNVGTTVNYTESVIANDAVASQQLAQFVSDLTSGSVNTAIVIGGNPVYNAPGETPVAAALSSIPFSVHFSLYYDETSQSTAWHVPATHYVEAWGDARAHDGTVSVIQPPIGALYDTAMSAHEVVAMLASDERSGYEVIRDYWQGEYSGSEDFEKAWRRSLHDGFVAETAFETSSPSLSGDLASAVSQQLLTANEGLELILRPHPHMYDGRFAFNSWLHELPHPLTKISWDNVAMVSEATAEELGVANGDIVTLSVGTRSTEAPIWITMDHPDNAVSLALGYGRGIGGDVEADRSFNAYELRTTANAWMAQGLSVERTGDTHRIALTQKNFETFGTEPVASGTLATFLDNPEFAQHESQGSSFLAGNWDYAEDSNQWGMSIDLTSCIGCNACVIGCQSENSIPTVGKTEVLQEREMHWLRIDRYIDEHSSQHTAFLPVPCMHCENAPCEQVCPVQATVHDHEGLNQMVYNRCVGTRYCSANCPYGVRRFNFKDYIDDTPILEEQRNPDVSVRPRGVMEKCSYCWQRINAARVASSTEDRPIRDGEVLTACQTACPTQAIVFGNINDANAVVTREKAQPHSYSLLDSELNTRPRTTYLARISNPNDALYVEKTSESKEG